MVFVLFTLAAAEDACQTFGSIYGSGKAMCERMWGDAFLYEPDEDKGYTMWFFGDNANDGVSSLLHGQQPDQCHLSYFHKELPTPEGDAFTECHPWKERSCCAQGTVETHTKLKEGYGPEYHWDRCGPLSQACERFFVQEACFYECDPHAGLYRRFPSDAQPSAHANATEYDPRCDEYHPDADSTLGCAHNTWEVYRMPIKASYCDAWYTACQHDLFCSKDDGNYYSCATHYESLDALALQAERAAEQDLLQSAEAGRADAEDAASSNLQLAVAAGVLFALSLALFAYTVQREKAGSPLFASLPDPGPEPARA